jgi:hypothetical protein
VIRGRTIALAGAALALALLGSACSSEESAPAAATSPQPMKCPAAWKGGWHRLAERIDSAVYCPTWMPSPLDGRIGGQWDNGVSVRRDRSYLVSFLWHEPPAQDVHVNFRAYPGRTEIPRCEDTRVVAGKKRTRLIPCFSDPHPTRRIGRHTVTAYTVNQGVDMWHVLYLWRERGTTYTLSEHVAKPLTYRQVVAKLDRMMRGLVRVEPTATA